MRVLPIATFVFAVAFSGHGVTAEPPPADSIEEQFVEVPPPPPPIAVDAEDESDAETEPEVTIIRRQDTTYEEYRLNGRLYMVKVVPAIGKPYYFIDRDGDGLMESRMNDRGAQIQVPQWVIFSW
jgi:hypothetical protein